MSLTYEPKTEEQLEREMLFEEGEYDFEITKAEERLSKSGNPMLELKLNVFDENGNKRIISDYLLTSSAWMEFKLRHAAFACGLGEQYETGSLGEHDFNGRSGKCKIGIQKASGDYPAKNVVQDYIVSENAAPLNGSEPFIDDEIPFN